MFFRPSFLLVIGASIAISACQSTSPKQTAACKSADNLNAVKAGKHCIGITTYPIGQSKLAPKAILVYLHGSVSQGGPASYMHRHADQPPVGTVSIVMLRPGYSDYDGRRSSGSHNGRRDDITAENVDAIADALRALREHYKQSRLVVIGHSAGAIVTAVILGRHPGIIDTAILVSCPCDLAGWRSERSTWYQSLDPMNFVERVPKTTTVYAFTGSRDDNTRPEFAQRYVNRMRALGVSATFKIVDRASHRFGSIAYAYGTALRSSISAAN